MAFGTFDIFHKGHEFYISEAKKYVDTLIIVIARDERVLRVKQKAPQHTEIERQKYVQQAFPDTTVILGDAHNIMTPLYTYTPDMLFFGYDQYIPKDILDTHFPKIETRVIDAFMPDIYKSSLLRKKDS